VNGTDFALLASRFGQSLGGPSVSLSHADYAAVAAFGATIPEPSSAVLCIIAAGVTLCRRPRARAARDCR
jgi:hypothetical protein